MKVKYLVGAAGPGVNIQPGDIIDVSAEEGKRLCERKICVPVRQRKRKATIDPVESRNANTQ